MIMKKELLYPFDANYILAKKKKDQKRTVGRGRTFCR